MKFYRCKHCGQIITKVKDSNVDLVCCGEKMEELVPCSTDAAVEKHVPVAEIVEEGKIKVTVGEVIHPMIEAHFIEWIAYEGKKGIQIKFLKPEEEPKAGFKYCINCDAPVAVYAYCNLHGLWKKDL